MLLSFIIPFFNASTRDITRCLDSIYNSIRGMAAEVRILLSKQHPHFDFYPQFPTQSPTSRSLPKRYSSRLQRSRKTGDRP